MTERRVEGEGALELEVRDGGIETLHLRIFEPPRYFEKFLEGREGWEVLDIVPRICGICPVAYQLSAVHAMEQAFGVQPTPWVRALRRLMYCGEWLQSHSLHIHLLALPDFLGFESALAMGKQHPEEVARGLRLQGLGNAILRLLGGRSVHPVGVMVGGFHHAPSAEDAAQLCSQLEAAIPEAAALVRWTAALPLPEDEQDFVTVCLRHPDEYAMNEGHIVSGDGLDIDAGEYPEHFEEYHAPHSTALFSRYHDGPYLVGPLARLNLNLDRLPAEVADNLAQANVTFPSRNMFHSVVARAVEIHLALVEAVAILRQYAPTAETHVEAVPKAGIGAAGTEAPRGLLWHRYVFNDEGKVAEARIVPPTSQNQLRIEEDLHRSLTAFGLDQADEALRLRAETVIRNYDPCISCATHFLNIHVKRA
ncbi:MAG: Ni/Fe hydrogenase subunit alpha [Acidihalobacter sp.]